MDTLTGKMRSTRSKRRLRLAAWATGAVLALALVPVSPASALTPVPGSDPLLLPDTVASVGDSISVRPVAGESWTTGNLTSVNSIRTRLATARGTSVTGVVKAIAGKDTASLATMMNNAIAATEPGELITVGIGGNDACADTNAEMTSAATYRSRVSYALGLAETAGRKVVAISVPNIYGLWEAAKDTAAARNVWAAYNICANMLGNPLSTAQADVDRRDAVKQRIDEYNEHMRIECGKRSGCSYDGGAVNAIALSVSDLGSDYFHPNASGQAKIATAAWPAVQAIWPGVFAPPTVDTTKPTGSITSPATGSTVSGSVTITATATDNVAVSKVLFYADGTINLGQATALGGDQYSLTVDTTQISDGTKVLKARVFDTSNNLFYSAPVTITVDNTTPPPDTTAPSVSVTSPANNATVSGTATMTIAATDNVGVTGVSIYYYSQLVGNATQGAGDTWTYSLNSTGYSNGSKPLTVRATDAAGNIGTANVTIVVSN